MIRLIIGILAASCAVASNSGTGAPLFFVRNHGQAPPAVRFIGQSSGLTAYFSAQEVLLRAGTHSVRMRLEGADPQAGIEGSRPLPGSIHFLTGPPEGWRTNESPFGAVVYGGVYPGIDMLYGGQGNQLKSEFMVAPGADPGLIRMRYAGVRPRVDRQGNLEILSGGFRFVEQAPLIYQERDGRREQVRGKFLVAGGAVGFRVGAYDRSLALVIDPVVYSTLLGGVSSDSAMALAVDSAGSAYVAGFTASYDFPMANPAQSANAGGNDVFIAKLNPAGNALVYCTFVGGRADDRAYGIAVDATGAAYVTGFTTSTNFPLQSPLQNKLLGAKNAFVLKLSPAGNSLVFSTYLGGSASDIGYGIAVDGSGNIYVAGDSTSPNLPTTASAVQRINRGGADAFVAKLDPAGTTLVYATYLGGSYEEHGAAIAVDSGGTAYLTGSTYSSDFPVSNALQVHIGGGQDAFLARLDAGGTALLFSTFLGGTGGSLGYPETGQGIALDAQGNAYIAGGTSSTNFPLLLPMQSSRRGVMDAFVAKVDSSGALVYSTYLGGAGVDQANAIAIDATGAVYIAGQTLSTNLAVTGNAIQMTNGGSYDAFLAKLTPAGDAVTFLSYLGGSGSETATAAALDAGGNLYLAGWSLSTNFPVLGAYQTINAGTYGAFLTKVFFGELPTITSVTPNSGSGSSQTFTLQISDIYGATDLTSVSALFSATTAVTGACSVKYVRAANTLALLTDAGAAPAGTITPGSGSQQNSQCTLNGAGSSVSLSGNVLTLNLAIAFQGSFSGLKNIYAQAVNPNGSTGLLAKGSWTISGGPPAAVSVTPSSGSGSSQTFSFVFSDPRGYAAISTASIIINASLTGTNSCYLYFPRASNAIYLANDAGTAWVAQPVLGSSVTPQNTQCSVSAAASSSSGSGNNLTVNLALTFSAAFAGSKNIYMQVYDGVDSGWQNKGTWTVVASGPPAAVSVTPASGTGSSQTFAFAFSDPRGYAAISTASMIVGSTLSGSGSCYLYFARASNSLYLANDTGTAWVASAVLGGSSTLQNSQCSVSVAGSSSSGSGNSLTLNLALSFKATFAGAKNIYMQVYDGLNSGWQTRGTWAATSPNILAPVSVSPSSGTGSSQTFAFVYNDPAGYATISSASVIVGATLSGTGNCYLFYARATNSIYLANDAGSAWLTPAVLGTSVTLQNSQCSVNVAASSAIGSGNTLTVNLALGFKPAFTGTKQVYLAVYDGANSGWTALGSWIVP